MRQPWRHRLIAALLGAFVLLIVLELGLRVIALGFSLRQHSFDPEALQGKGDLTVLCIGESTTAMGGSDSWPSQLGRELQERLPGRRVAAINRGVPGVDSSVLLAQLENNLETFHPDVVAAMMGANDLWTGAIPWEETPMAERPVQHLKTWKLAQQLLHELRTLPSQDANTGPLDTRRWIKVDGPRAEPQSAGSLRDRLTVAQARRLASKGDLEGAARLLEAAAQRHPGSALLREELGVVLRVEGRLDDAEASLQEAHKLAPTAASVLVELAAVFVDRATLGDDGESRESASRAEQFLRQAIELAPERLEATRRLAFQLQSRGAYDDAIALIVGAPGERFPEDGLDDLLIRTYEMSGRTYDAAALLWGNLELENDACNDAWYELIDLLHALRRDQNAATITQWIQDTCVHPKPSLLRSPRHHLPNADSAEQADTLDSLPDTSVRATYCPLTHRSFERLSATLGERGILLIAVQYPRRPLESLERYIQPRPGVVLVDNAQPFDDAVSTEGYDAIFIDHCYGDLGHATPRGNAILAERVADAIVGAMGVGAGPGM